MQFCADVMLNKELGKLPAIFDAINMLNGMFFAIINALHFVLLRARCPP